MNKGSNTNLDVSNHVRWQIPRASLSSGSRSMYSSTDSIQGSLNRVNQLQQHNKRNMRRESYSIESEGMKKKLNERRDEGPYSMPSSSVSSLSSTMQPNKKFSRRKFSENIIMNGSQIDELTAVADERVHGSSSRSSSQGSSSNSLHSASSMLLSVQNLEKFTRMTNNQGRINNLRNIPRNECDNGNGKLQSSAATNNHMIIDINKIIASKTTNGDNNNDDIDTGCIEELHHNNLRRKDHDQLSIASSTHFTLVNGCGRSTNLKSHNSFCRHGRQITILIVTMTIFFTIGILFVLYLMDRRAKAMPAFHQ
ncbi:GATA zinc finger domain-containing protein 14-like [Chironomus tepperi]|uniref:GATA zinc finger domain-containing protein 14-like n=1 Tax=Chironomus tepperi TaxID=113505 RepID=UPI00391FA8E3